MDSSEIWKVATGAWQTYVPGSASPPNWGGNKGKKMMEKNNKFENDKWTILTDKKSFSKVEWRKTQWAQWYKEKWTWNIYHIEIIFIKMSLRYSLKWKTSMRSKLISWKIKPGTASKDKTIHTK